MATDQNKRTIKKTEKMKNSIIELGNLILIIVVIKNWQKIQ